MVRAWIADVTPLYEDECYRKYYDSLPDFRKKKADALRTVEMKAQSVGVWTLWERIRTVHELPEDAAFNLSHSGTYAMCAAELDASRERVGCDLEKIGELRGKSQPDFSAGRSMKQSKGRGQGKRRPNYFTGIGS